jgi:hypothetical protein
VRTVRTATSRSEQSFSLSFDFPLSVKRGRLCADAQRHNATHEEV